MPPIVIVTGASRGVGKGVALALGSTGATVYVTGRTRRGDAHAIGGSIDDTADEVTARGGRGIAVACDHTDDASVAEVFDRVNADHGRLDVLVNNAFAIPSGTQHGVPFFELPLAAWDTMIDVGLRSHYIASVLAARRMVVARAGLIVNISSFGAGSYQVNVPYGVGKAGVDRLTRDSARDLAPFDIAVISLWPGIVRTERMLAGQFPYDITISESPELTGRAIAALLELSATERASRSGKALVVAELAAELGFTDIDGTRPASLRRAKK